MRTVVKLALGFALLASLAVPPALGAGAEQSALEQAGLSQNFQDYLPEPTAQVPWLNLDTRTKLPKTGLPLGRSADGIERLVLQPIVPNVQISSNTWSD
jgi:hypothetical protein